MNIETDSLSPTLFYFAGILIAFFASVLILGKSQKTMADYLLSSWFFIIGIHLSFFLFLFSGDYVKFPYLLGLEIPLPLLHGPMLYLYIRFLTGSDNKKTWLLHFAPVFIVYIMLSGFFLKSPEEKIIVYNNGGADYKTLRSCIKIIIVVSGMTYIILSFQTVRSYRKAISEMFSNTEKINLNWVNYLIIGMALIWVAVILKNEILLFSLVAAFIILAAYLGISHAGILNLKVLNPEADQKADFIEADPSKVKYQKNFAGEDVIAIIYDRLIEQMEHERIFTDPELSLDHVAQLLDVHPNILSQTINHIENKNFYDFINRRRVEEFKRIALLPENYKYTLLALAFESGFNSKTSFNRNFKKYEHCSPSEFIKNSR